MTFRHCVAVDLGASSGRVMLATGLRPAHPYASRNAPFRQLSAKTGRFCYGISTPGSEIRTGLHNVCEDGIRIDSIGIDTWGVDYVLLDRHGERVGLPVSYRDSRTDGLMAHAIAQLGKENIYGRSGIQFLPFNTLYQLRALVEQQPELVEKVAHALLIPDYLSYRLTGNMNWEYTNATTTQLVNINTDNWDEHLLARTGASPSGLARQPIRAM